MVKNIQSRFPDVQKLALFKVFDSAQAREHQGNDYGFNTIEELAAQFPSKLDARGIQCEWEAFSTRLLTQEYQVINLLNFNFTDFICSDLLYLTMNVY